jgi:parvulin-like peptidyl-prolyl isomerase
MCGWPSPRRPTGLYAPIDPDRSEDPAVPHRTCCALLLFVVPALAAAGEKAAVTVNGEAIPVAELDAAVAQLPAPERPVSNAQKQRQRAELLDLLIDDRLVRQFLRQKGPKVEPAEVERQFAGLAAGLKNQGKTVDEYLKECGLTEAQAKDNLLRMLQLGRYTEAKATTDQLRSYFEANREFFDKTTVRTSHIVIRVPASAPAGERQKAQEKLRGIRADLSAKRVEFAAAAKAHSQCPSAPNGGDVGYIVRKFQADEPYARTAFALPVGGVSDVVETDQGYHLIWVTDRKPGKAVKYEDVAAEVRECFEAELKQILVAELRKTAKIQKEN